MSASLVGSEMCIRDRHACERLPTPRAPSAAPAGHRVVGAISGRRSTVRAVSYTHLTLPTICSV
eukprot:12806799-Alexandrium_andersonii.AAC.1